MRVNHIFACTLSFYFYAISSVIYLLALLAGLLAGAALGFGTGFGAAELFTKIGGSREGANAMGGFFFIGPFGLVAGFLAGFGAVVRYGGGSTAIAKWSLLGGGVVAALGAILVLFLIASQSPGRFSGGGAAFVLEYELELPPEIDPAQVKYGYHGEGPERVPSWTFPSVTRRDNGAHVVASSMEMSDSPSSRTILLSLDGTKVLRFGIPLAGYVTSAADWTEWKEGDGGIRYRWQLRGSN